MDASPKRKKKSVKGRRRSLRNLQPADLVESYNDLPAKNQQLYGSIWLDQAETPPISVTKPRRRSSVYNAQQFHHLNKENVFKPLEKGTFTPKSNLPKSVELAPERTPVFCPAKNSDYFIKNARNNENDPEEIEVAHFWQRGQDASLSTECKKTVDILAIDEKHTKHQDETINHSIKDELQLSVDFSEKEQNKTNLSNKSLSPDQLTAEPFIKLVTTFMEPMASLSHQDYFSESVHDCSESTNNLDDNFPSLTSPSETLIHHSCLPILSGKQISSIPQKDLLQFSPDLCQDFQQLDISKNVCIENDLQGNIWNEGFRALNQNSHESLPTSDSSILDNDFSLNKAFSQTLNSSYSNNDMSSLNESTLSENLDLWETDLSSAGSELSDSWCFSRHFNSANDFDSTPCKTDNSRITSKIDKGYFAESEKDLIFPPEDEIKKIYPETVASSSVCTPTKEEENMPAIEYLSLDDHFPFDLNGEPQTHMHEKFRIEGTGFCVTPNDESIKILPSENFQKNLTQKITDSKIPELRLSKKGVLSTTTKKTINNSNTSSSNCPSLNSVDNGFKGVTKLTLTKTIKQSVTVNIKKSDKYSNDSNKLKSTCLNKNINGEKSLTLGGQDSYEQPKNKSRNAIQVEKTKSKFQQKAVSPDVLIFDSLKKSPQINIIHTMKSKTETAKNTNQISSRSPSVKKQCLLKKTSKSLATVKMSREDRNLNQLPRHTTYQQENNQPVIVSTTDEVPTKTSFIETFSKEKWLKKNNASTALDQTSSVATTVAETSKSLPTVKTHYEDRNQSLKHMTYQQEDSQPAIVSTDVVPSKAYFVETLSEEKWLKGLTASAALDQISCVATTAAETNRYSQDSYSTSNITIKRPNTKVKKKSINMTCDAEAQPDFGSEKNITLRQTSSQCTKLRSLPVLEIADVAVIDLESSVSSDGDGIFNRPVAKTVKRRCQSIGSVYFSIDQSLFNDDDDDEEAMLPSTYVAVSHEDNKESTTKDGEADSVGLREKSLEMLIDIPTESPHLTLVNDVTPKKPRKPARTKRKSTGSIPAKKSQNKEATSLTQSDSASLEPVMILEESFHVAHSQKQTGLRRSTRRSSIELSLSSNAKHSAVSQKGKKQISTCAESTEKKFSFSKGNDDDDKENECLKEIYTKKPYVPVSPTRLETIYSPNKKRNDKNVFGKRKISRTLTFIPSETQLKNRQKKAMRNWPFLFMVPKADEKLNKLLNITEVKPKRKK